MKPQTRLVAGVLAAVTAGGVAVAIGVALLLGNTVHLRSSANATLRTGTYLAATINVERLVIDAETGLRGYVITAKPLFLAPTRSAEAQLPQATAALEQAARRDGAYVARATALADSSRSYVATYGPRVIAEVTSDPRAARSVATTAMGKSLVDGIRAQTAALESLISARQAARQRVARSSANDAVRVAIVELIALTALTVLIGGILGRALLGRERARERAAFLAEASASLDRLVTGGEVLEKFAELVTGREAEVCVAEELSGDERAAPELELARVTAGDPQLLSPSHWSEIDAAWEKARAVAAASGATAAQGAALGSGERVHVIALAGMARGSLVVRVVVARHGREWRREDVDELADLGARLALALHARALQARTEALYRRSEHTARTLQQSLLPTSIPDVPSCELAIRFTPAGAGDLVGGDFYDAFPVGTDHWALVLGDVCGKGSPAAAVTAMARWTLRSFAGSARRPAEVLRSLNDAMLRQSLDGRFITIVYALLRVGDDEAHATVACAGHPPAIFVSAAGEPSTLGACGDLLGIWPDVRLYEVEQRLGAGESLVLYTDGVTDQGPGSERSPARALRTRTHGASANAFADALEEEAEEWSGAPRDDVAIVALRYSPDGVDKQQRIEQPTLTGASGRP